MTPLRRCVLVVDDEFLIAESLALQVEDLGIDVCGTADTARDAIAMAEMHRPCLILMDMRLKGTEDGVDAALAIHDSVGSKVIFITGSREPATMARIETGRPAAILLKPIFGRQLQTAIENAIGP